MSAIRPWMVALWLGGSMGLWTAGAWAQGAVQDARRIQAVGAEAGSQVVVGGQVPDEATRQAVLAALRQVYGMSNVVDKMEVVGDIGVPVNWAANVQKLLTPALKQVQRGQLQIEGTQVVVSGDVNSETLRQKIVSDMASSLNPAYTVRNGLRVPAVEQSEIDAALANRIIEFEAGSATLTHKGREILDEMLPSFRRLTNQTVAIIGHTDDSGSRSLNLSLSQARADTVKGYLVNKGIDPAIMTTSGVGPDQPVAANDSDQGRARNRRIEFRVGKT